MNIIHKDEYTTLIQGDCLNIMNELIKTDIKFDAVITDIPQQITKNGWDNIIPFKEMWKCLYELRCDKNVPIILFTNQPFTTYLLNSNIEHFKIMKYWQKDRPSGFLNAKRMPLKDIEEIAIFYENQCYYNPQMWEGMPLHGMGKKFEEEGHLDNNNYGKFDSHTNPSAKRCGDTMKYPRQLMYYKRPHPPIHPTQKPVELIEDLISTYTRCDDYILDFTCGSGTTLIAAKNLHRNCIGIELEERYCEIAKSRLE